MIESLKKLITALVSIAVFIFLLGFALGTVLTPPLSALVFVDDQAHEFITPPFAQVNSAIASRFSRLSTYGEARAAHFSAEHACNEQQCWSQEGRSLSGKLLESIGLLPRLPSRWKGDGEWNW